MHSSVVDVRCHSHVLPCGLMIVFSFSIHTPFVSDDASNLYVHTSRFQAVACTRDALKTAALMHQR